MSALRKTIVAISAIAAVGMGLERIGVTPLFPGKDIGLKIEPVDGAPRLRLTTDAGDLDLALEILIEVEGEPEVGWNAQIKNRPLKVSSRRDGLRTWHIRLGPPHDDHETEKFSWPSGTELRLSALGQADAISVLDWKAYLKDSGHDSLARERRRRAWFWLSLVLLPASLVGTVLPILGAPRRAAIEPVTKERLLAQILAGVTGRDEEEGRRMRLFLDRLLIDGATTEEAFEAIGPFESRTAQMGFFFRALSRARSRVANVIVEMNGVLARLDSLRPAR